ncbi:MAG TPA: hypothetical protein VMM76_00495 [Pirellulaceae bacterium]|nr:hypothetical protein [Pirellulaceae bacterium]
MSDTTRSYSDIRRSLDDATREVDTAIDEMSDVLSQRQDWQSSRSRSEMQDKVLREKIDFHKLHTPEIKSLVHKWQQAAHDEYNFYNNAHDDSILPPRNWHHGK